MIAPLFNQLPSKYPKAIFLKVDVVSLSHLEKLIKHLQNSKNNN
jgi:hypothetical protein